MLTDSTFIKNSMKPILESNLTKRIYFLFQCCFAKRNEKDNAITFLVNSVLENPSEMAHIIHCTKKVFH